MHPGWNFTLRDQLDLHLSQQLRPRFEGLTDDEYLWEPVSGCWSVRQRSTASGRNLAKVAVEVGEFQMDIASPAPEPSPMTTIAWRLAHVIVGVLGMRNASHFGRAPVDYLSHDYACTAAKALKQLGDELARWQQEVAALGEDGLLRPMGPTEGPYADRPMADLILHVNRELIHHGAEIALFRDLYSHAQMGSWDDGTTGHGA